MKFFANGSDHFQVLLEKQMRENGQHGNVGRLLLKIDGQTISDNIKNRLNSNLAKQIYSLKYHATWFRSAPYWEAKELLNPCPLKSKLIEGESIFAELPLPDFDLNRAQLYKTYLIEFKDEKYFLFIWHHLLFDARGGELFARFIIGEIKSLDRNDVFPDNPKKHWKDLLIDARDSKDFLMTDRGMVINSAADKRGAKKSKIHYKFLKFSREETIRIQKKSSNFIRLVKSPFYLACTAYCFKELLEKRKVDWTSLWMPVPQDQRLKGSIKPVMGNHISYLFFRLKPNDFKDLKSVAQNLKNQMMYQVKQKTTTKYASMMTIFARFPLWFYDFITKGPTHGVFASFFFSDTGLSLNQPNNNNSIKILDAWHFPPANTYPGLTIVYSMFKDQLKLSICHTEDSLSDSEYTTFETKLRNRLLDDET